MKKRKTATGADHLRRTGQVSVLVPLTAEEREAVRRAATLAGYRSSAAFGRAALAAAAATVEQEYRGGKKSEEIRKNLERIIDS